MIGQIVIDKNLISYFKVGSEQAKQATLFSHGWRSNAQVWGSVIESLKLSNQRIYAIDLPGFGNSPAPQSEKINLGWSVGDYANIVASFIKKQDLKNVMVVGHSFGGRIGIKLAAQHPGIISKLVLVDSAGFVINYGKKTLMQVAAKIFRPFFRPKFMQGLRAKIYQRIGAEDYLATPELQKTFVNVVNEDLTTDMAKINVPTCIIFGENDQATPPKFGWKMHSLIPNSTFLILENAGHFSFLDQREEFVKLLNQFTIDNPTISISRE